MSDLSTVDVLLRVTREALLLVLLVSAPPLLASLLVGVLVGVLQAATQVQDQTLSFVPKLIVVVVVLVVCGPWIGAQLVRFSQSVFMAAAVIR